jgi:ribosomal protein S18 acetylase RimI-like enzyme
VHERGDRALLHAAASNTHAIRLYRGLGFALRRTTDFGVVRTPEA